MVIVWIQLRWEQISAFSIAFAVSHYAPWHALANCQFLCIFVCLFVFCFAKMILLTEGQAPLYLFVTVSKFFAQVHVFAWPRLPPWPILDNRTPTSSNNEDHKIDLSAVLA